MPMNITVKKSTALVLCLCKLHNFCIEEQEGIEQPMACDVVHIANNGGISLPQMDDNDEVWNYNEDDDRIDGLLDGGEHFNDINRNVRCRWERNTDLPCMSMLKSIKDGGYQRPEVHVDRN